MTEKLGARRAVLAVVLAGALVTYGGVSLFVAFLVLGPMAQALFRAADIPGRLMPSAIALACKCPGKGEDPRTDHPAGDHCGQRHARHRLLCRCHAVVLVYLSELSSSSSAVCGILLLPNSSAGCAFSQQTVHVTKSVMRLRGTARMSEPLSDVALCARLMFGNAM
jgi:hypothetical protein